MKEKRDKHADREADKDTDDEGRDKPPSGSMGPGGTAIEKLQGEGGAMEPDPPEDQG
jgi:hypothetical protein